jgi:hypothetical protein
MLALAPVLAAQEPFRPLPPPIARDRLLAAARTADLAEAGADVLLRALDHNVISSPDDTVLLAEEAFRLANLAILQVPRQPRGMTDTVETYSAAGDQYRITRMDLQARAVAVLANINKVRAVELFQQIQTTAPKTDCSSPQVYGFRNYFQTLRVLLQELTGDEEAVMVILRKQVAQAKTPSQFTLLAGIVEKSPVADRNHDMAMSFAAALHESSLQFDPRSFEEDAMPLMESVEKLSASLQTRGATVRVNRLLIAGIRRALVRHFSGSQCRFPGPYTRDQLLSYFNIRLLPFGDIGLILPKDVANGKRDGGSWTVTPFWEDDAPRRLNRRMAVLAHAGTPVDRESEEWKKSANAMFEDVRTWADQGEPDDPVLQFCQKVTLLRGLLQIRLDPAPVTTNLKREEAYRRMANLPDRVLVLKEIVQTLAGPKGNQIKAANRGAWLRTAEDLEDFYWHSRRADSLYWIMALNASGDPTLRAFAVLAEVSAFPPQ